MYKRLFVYTKPEGSVASHGNLEKEWRMFELSSRLGVGFECVKITNQVLVSRDNTVRVRRRDSEEASIDHQKC